MLPDIIIHNSISLDGALINFKVNMGLHYQIAGRYKPDAHLIGSNTIKTGLETEGVVLSEDKNDFIKTDKNKNIPYWVIPDTKGILSNNLHVLRRFEFCREVIILISKITPKKYVKYLKDRNYDYFVIGEDKVDLKKSMGFLLKNYNIKTIVTDTGSILGNLLINQGLVRKISLLIHPVIVGKKSNKIFNNINSDVKLKLLHSEILDESYIWFVYEVEK
jgi:2,5-diamino-6-(ribosylamino)-4(3H)-pyrimidinone 5'-phosphate reductase